MFDAAVSKSCCVFLKEGIGHLGSPRHQCLGESRMMRYIGEASRRHVRNRHRRTLPRPSLHTDNDGVFTGTDSDQASNQVPGQGDLVACDDEGLLPVGSPPSHSSSPSHTATNTSTSYGLGGSAAGFSTARGAAAGGVDGTRGRPPSMKVMAKALRVVDYDADRSPKLAESDSVCVKGRLCRDDPRARGSRRAAGPPTVLTAMARLRLESSKSISATDFGTRTKAFGEEN